MVPLVRTYASDSRGTPFRSSPNSAALSIIVISLFMMSALTDCSVSLMLWRVLTSEPHEDGLAPFVRDLLYVPPLKSAMDLLGELRQSEIPAAVVVNERGSCIGIVELIDILEKIVGEITANRKPDTPRIEKLGKSEWRIDARALIAEVNMTLDAQIPVDRCDTVGGFILMLLGRLPQKGEKVEYEDLDFNIEEVFKYGISRILASKKPQRTRR